MATFTECEAKLSFLEIEDIEKFVNLKFPEEYKAHLLEFNGGKCEPNTFSFKENGVETSSALNWFFAIYDGQYTNLRREIESVKIQEKRMPTHILPIAEDPLGNLICISCSGKDQGYIYFWDHEKEVDYSAADDTDYSNLYLISESFNKFVEGLYEFVEDS